MLLLSHRFLFVLALCAVHHCVAVIPPYEEHYYTQTVDHFNFGTQPQTFQQRYLLSRDAWQTGGPILFYPGNEGSIEGDMPFN